MLWLIDHHVVERFRRRCGVEHSGEPAPGRLEITLPNTEAGRRSNTRMSRTGNDRGEQDQPQGSRSSATMSMGSTTVRAQKPQGPFRDRKGVGARYRSARIGAFR